VFLLAMAASPAHAERAAALAELSEQKRVVFAEVGLGSDFSKWVADAREEHSAMHSTSALQEQKAPRPGEQAPQGQTPRGQCISRAEMLRRREQQAKELAEQLDAEEARQKKRVEMEPHQGEWKGETAAEHARRAAAEVAERHRPSGAAQSRAELLRLRAQEAAELAQQLDKPPPQKLPKGQPKEQPDAVLTSDKREEQDRARYAMADERKRQAAAARQRDEMEQRKREREEESAREVARRAAAEEREARRQQERVQQERVKQVRTHEWRQREHEAQQAPDGEAAAGILRRAAAQQQVQPSVGLPPGAAAVGGRRLQEQTPAEETATLSEATSAAIKAILSAHRERCRLWRSKGSKADRAPRPEAEDQAGIAEGLHGVTRCSSDAGWR